MGHDEHHGHEGGHSGPPTNGDLTLVYKIQPIDLVKHNPNIFWLSPFSVCSTYDIVGGHKTAFLTVAGASIAVKYYNNQTAHLASHFYKRNMHVWGRVLFGGFIGLSIGYLKFGDRQRVHNAYTADRLFRRYKESRKLTANNLEALRGTIPE